MTRDTDELRLDFSGNLQFATTSKSKRYFARFVRAGQIKGSNGKPTRIKLDPAALSAGADKFDNKAVFLDHAGFFDYPSLSKLVGTTTGAYYNAQEQSIQGEIRLFETPGGELAEKVIEEILSNPGNSPDVGLSIVFYPAWNKEHDTILGVNHVESVDLVFQPAADGRILQALSTLYQQHYPQENPNMLPNLPETPMIHDTQPSSTRPTPDTLTAWTKAAAEAAINTILSASDLPQPSKDRLAQGKYSKPEELTAAIEAERQYLAKLSQDQVITIGNNAPRSHLSGMSTSLDRLQKALEALLSGVRPPDNIQPLTGIRELYHLLSGDYEMSGLFHPDRIQFGNVNSSTMASLVANVLNKVVMAEFQEYPKWWEPIATQVDFASLQAVRWSILGGVGELPTVAEGAAYTELTWDDKYETAAFIKKGGYLGLTMEAIDKDDTGRLRNAPRALAQAAWLTLSKSISSIFTRTPAPVPLWWTARLCLRFREATWVRLLYPWPNTPPSSWPCASSPSSIRVKNWARWSAPSSSWCPQTWRSPPCRSWLPTTTTPTRSATARPLRSTSTRRDRICRPGWRSLGVG